MTEKLPRDRPDRVYFNKDDKKFYQYTPFGTVLIRDIPINTFYKEIMKIEGLSYEEKELLVEELTKNRLIEPSYYLTVSEHRDELIELISKAIKNYDNDTIDSIIQVMRDISNDIMRDYKIYQEEMYNSNPLVISLRKMERERDKKDNKGNRFNVSNSNVSNFNVPSSRTISLPIKTSNASHRQIPNQPSVMRIPNQPSFSKTNNSSSKESHYEYPYGKEYQETRRFMIPKHEEEHEDKYNTNNRSSRINLPQVIV